MGEMEEGWCGQMGGESNSSFHLTLALKASCSDSSLGPFSLSLRPKVPTVTPC